MLRDDAIYNLSFRFQNIDFDNINDINFTINIVIIAITLFEIFVIIALIFEFIIVIVFDVDIVVIIVIVFFKRFIFKLIAFGFDIKDCFIMSALFDKS